jgi:hypothetical protein
LKEKYSAVFNTAFNDTGNHVEPEKKEKRDLRGVCGYAYTIDHPLISKDMESVGVACKSESDIKDTTETSQ